MRRHRHLHRHHHQFAIHFLILAVSFTSILHTQGRKQPQTPTDFGSTKTIWGGGRIGSRPPRCEQRCAGCGHCEAVQVPTNPKVKRKSTASSSSSSSGTDHDDDSNYKPLSWKCKCGNFIFNP